ncbi:MAG: hypothetical protein JRG82_13700, partial [Deltaproteobacteria bacterium]|nr:hypothetical protein [Deltaproteobacteria bacterium]
RIEPDEFADPAYPVTTPPDPVYPCQTREPLASPLDGVATPAMASRLVRPMDRALGRIWEGLGLLARHRPERQVSLHYGRIALNAHAWERLRANLTGEPPDPALAGLPDTGFGRLPELWESFRVRMRRGRLLARLQRAEDTGEALLADAIDGDWRDRATAELSRGLLDERAWVELLMPYFSLRMLGEEAFRADARVRAAIAFEQRCSAEIGRRLAADGVLYNPSDVAYLTVEERTRAVHDGTQYWMKVVSERVRRVEGFLDLEVPLRFWGSPRVEKEKPGG